MAHRDTQRNHADAGSLEAQAASLLTSLKGIEHAQVECDAQGHIVRIAIQPQGIDDRAAMRNVQSALMAVFGQAVDINAIAIAGPANAPKVKKGEAVVAAAAAVPEPGVLALKIPPVRHGELNVAAKTAFETLRAAQASFHGFQFDGAELVRINGSQCVVVSLKRGSGDATYCGAAPVLESVSTASARALLNAVGAAAMSGSALDLDLGMGADVRALNA